MLRCRESLRARIASFFVMKKRCNMAIATYKQRINGKFYDVGDTLPVYGSVTVLENKHNILYCEFNVADLSKLPTWCNEGSKALAIDTGDAYSFTGGSWVKIGG